MGLRITIQDNFLDLAEAFKELDSKQLEAAGRRAINRTLLTMRKEAIILITQKVKVKPKELRDRYISLDKPGSGVSSLQGAIVFSGESLHLMKFVKGDTSPIKQKGIPIKRRRKLKVEITPGKRFVLKGGFIQKANSNQVFKRGKGRSLIRQTAPSIAFMITDRGIGEILVTSGQNRLHELLKHELEYQVMKAAERAAKGLG